MKKLIPALAMLLIAAVLMGTSTYAWFSMNTTVQATGMQVKATTSANLVIANSTGTPYGVSAATSFTGVNSLKPASTSVSTDGVLSAGKFFNVNNGDTVIYATGAAQATTEFVATTVTPDAANDYVAAHTFNIKVDGASSDKFTNLYIKTISVKDSGAAPDQNISKALRVGVVSGSHAYIFEPVSGASASYKGVIAAGAGIAEGTTISTTAETITTAGTGATLGQVTSTAPVTVTVYIWYEGQDAACTSANSVNVEQLSVEIEFEGANS